MATRAGRRPLPVPVGEGTALQSVWVRARFLPSFLFFASAENQKKKKKNSQPMLAVAPG